MITVAMPEPRRAVRMAAFQGAGGVGLQQTLEAYILGAAMFLRSNNRLVDVLAGDDDHGTLVKRALRTRSIDDDEAFETGYVALFEQLLSIYGPNPDKRRVPGAKRQAGRRTDQS